VFFFLFVKLVQYSNILRTQIASWSAAANVSFTPVVSYLVGIKKVD